MFNVTPSASPPKRVMSGPELLLRSLGFGEMLDKLIALSEGGLINQMVDLVTQENIDKTADFLKGLERFNATLERVEKIIADIELSDALQAAKGQSGNTGKAGPGPGSDVGGPVGAGGADDGASATDGPA